MSRYWLRGLLRLLLRVLQFLDLRAQRAHFVLQHRDLPQQVGGALPRGGLALEHRDPFGQAGALREHGGRHGQQHRTQRENSNTGVHRIAPWKRETAKE